MSKDSETHKAAVYLGTLGGQAGRGAKKRREPAHYLKMNRKKWAHLRKGAEQEQLPMSRGEIRSGPPSDAIQGKP
jgi:hypothetical protein